MASNDGQRLIVFGLSFRQHDTRKMHRILDHYERLPHNANDRVALYTNLTTAAREISRDEAEAVKQWLENGGEFPFARPARESFHTRSHVEEPADEDEDEDDENGNALRRIAHHPAPRQRPAPQQRPAPPRRPPHPPVQGFRGVGGILDPFMGHGTLNQQFQTNRSMFDIAGPGRRLGEEGEDTTLSVSENGSVAFTPDDIEAFEAILQDRPGREEHAYVEDQAQDEAEDSSDMSEDSEEDLQAEPEPKAEDDREADFEPSGPEIECEICCESLKASNFPSSTITLLCEHPAGVCYGCLAQCISVQIKEGVLGQLNCPSCPEKLSYEDIKSYATKEVFRRYDYLLSRTNKDMFMCLAPNCGAGQIHSGGKAQPLMVCNACGFEICTSHGMPWHKDQTCAQFDIDPSQIERLEEEEATAKLLAQSSKICPACHQGVSKAEGCDHMACRCGKTWCFVCEADWENIIRLGGSAHAITCHYNPNHVRKRADQLAAEKNRALEAVHGGAVSEELKQAREEFQANRRAAIRPKALEAAEKRMQEINAVDQGNVSEKKKGTKRKVALKAPWEEGAVVKKTFG